MPNRQCGKSASPIYLPPDYVQYRFQVFAFHKLCTSVAKAVISSEAKIGWFALNAMQEIQTGEAHRKS